MPFDPSDDDGWWPNPWAPQSGPGGGASYPYNWTDPFINSRTAIPNPVASAPAPFSAAALGAMAWHPPIFLSPDPSTWLPPPATFPNPFGQSRPAVNALPTDFGTGGILGGLAKIAAEQARANDPRYGPATGMLAGVAKQVADRAAAGDPLAGARWRGILGSLADLQPPPSNAQAAPSSLPMSRPFLPPDPIGFPGARNLYSYVGNDPLNRGDTTGFAADRPATETTPSITTPFPAESDSKPGVPHEAAPNAFANAPALDPSSSLPAGAPNAPGAALARSVLFNQPPPPWDMGARDRDLTSLDQAAQSLGGSDLPISKSGQPIVPPPPPQLSIPPLQRLDVARFLSPNLVDYFTRTPPPAPPFPATPGKIPSLDNPYAVPAALEAATWLIPEARIPGLVAGAAERGAAATIGRGSFSIVDWFGYPAYAARPKGPFRLIEGQEYRDSRDAADRINEYLHKTDPGTYAGKHIHEIHPIKFGGSPTELANKIALSPEDHYALNAWWMRVQRNVETGKVPGKDQ